jgi:hypothetical protein
VTDIKISQLTSLTSIDSTDVIVINDVSAGATKKAELSALLDLVSARNLHDSGDNVVVDGDLNVDNEIIAGGDITTETGTIAFGRLKDITENIIITKFVDAADGIGSNNNDTTIPTSAAVNELVNSVLGTAGVLQVDSAGSSTTLYPVMVGSLSGVDSTKVDEAFSFNAETNVLSVNGTVSATTFIGDGSQLTGIVGGGGVGIDSADVESFYARIVKLEPLTSQVIRYDSTGLSETDTLEFKAVTENFFGVQSYQFYVDEVLKATVSTDLDSARFTLADLDEPAYNSSVIVKVSALEDGAIQANDFVSVYGIKDGVNGKDAINVYLTNEVHIEAADSAGVLTGNLDDAGGIFKVYVGVTDITGDAGLNYSVINQNGISSSILSTGEYLINSFDSVGRKSGIADFRVEVPHTLVPGIESGSVTLEKRYSIAKQLGGSGRDGADGAEGVGARAVKVIPLNGQAIRYDSSGNEFDTLQFRAIPENGENTLTYRWSVKNASDADILYVERQNGGQTLFTLADIDEPGPESVKVIRCEMFENTNGTDSAEKAQDVVSIYGLVNGYSITGYLTNEGHVEPADSEGSPLTSFGDAVGTFKVFLGTEEIQTDPNVIFEQVSNTGISINLNDDGEYSLIGFSNDGTLVGTATMRAVVNSTLIPGSNNDVNIEKVFTVAKSLQGTQGLQGTGVGSTGLDARSVKLVPTNGQVIRYDQNNVESTVLNFTTEIEGFTGTVTYAFTYKNAFGGTFNTATPTSVSEYTLPDGAEPVADNAVVVRVQAFENAVLKATDYVTVYGVANGVTITSFLTNETHSEAANADGSLIGTLADAGGTFKVFLGSQLLPIAHFLLTTMSIFWAQLVLIQAYTHFLVSHSLKVRLM